MHFSKSHVKKGDGVVEAHVHARFCAPPHVQPVSTPAWPGCPWRLLAPSTASLHVVNPSDPGASAQARCTAAGASPIPMPLAPPGAQGSYLGSSEGPGGTGSRPGEGGDPDPRLLCLCLLPSCAGGSVPKEKTKLAVPSQRFYGLGQGPHP